MRSDLECWVVKVYLYEGGDWTEGVFATEHEAVTALDNVAVRLCGKEWWEAHPDDKSLQSFYEYDEDSHNHFSAEHWVGRTQLDCRSWGEPQPTYCVSNLTQSGFDARIKSLREANWDHLNVSFSEMDS